MRRIGFPLAIFIFHDFMFFSFYYIIPVPFPYSFLFSKNWQLTKSISQSLKLDVLYISSKRLSSRTKVPSTPLISKRLIRICLLRSPLLGQYPVSCICTDSFSSPLNFPHRYLLLDKYIRGCIDVHRSIRRILLCVVWHGLQSSRLTGGTLC